MIARKRSHGVYPPSYQWITVIFGPISGKYGWKSPKSTNQAGMLFSAVATANCHVFAVGSSDGTNPTQRALCAARGVRRLGTKPECALESVTWDSLHPSLLQFRIDDRLRRIGLVFWVQRHPYWTLERAWQILAEEEPLAPHRPVTAWSNGRITMTRWAGGLGTKPECVLFSID